MLLVSFFTHADIVGHGGPQSRIERANLARVGTCDEPHVAIGWSLMSDWRTATQLPPRGLTAKVLADRLVIDVEPSHRSVNSAQCDHYLLAIDYFEVINSASNRLS